MIFFEKMSEKDAQCLNALVLAYIGDAVQQLYVREKLARLSDSKTDDLHQHAAEIVNAHTQAVQAERLLQFLTDTERDVFMRGRNCKMRHKAKNQSGSDYRKATGFEAVIGYLYLTGNVERVKQLLEMDL